ncbi:DUF1501 domain-containing protein [Singulisphaera acidiphila]|uniref:Rhodanese domain-containing protein n=1 Tax=Singulisphaera acidiphila (strain ATCC BAA-1392 / DSM 18658 / VKM B-2454 / MOB10) TaxID=886293 RepID=L0DCW0_SINAD|nr:DUF1501 domain-containing protein [Singulisphaera acidiphila]AGA27209.1 hypothetical protein Sinac_2923 [Singulisphaera acidiphila DSM 18658]
MSDHLFVPSGMSRRHFMGHLAASAMAVPAAHLIGALEANAASPVRSKPKSCILLWMAGGPSHMDTWNLKPDSEKNGGPFKPIATSANGISICEHMPNIAKQMKHLSVIRSLNSKEGNHDRGTYMLHTGYTPNPTVVHPSFGTSFAYELGPKHEGLALPHAISINGPGVGAGFLGMAYSPFVVQNPNGKVANLEPPTGVDESRMVRRLSMLNLVEKNFISQRRGQGSADHNAVYNKTVRMMNDRKTKASLSLDSEPKEVRDLYGRGSFGSGCLMARKLVEMGVTFVEVSLGGWDTHAGAFDTLSNRLLPELDKGMSALVADLDQRGLLDDTVIAWMGDFGRTPRINQDAGRDHWPRSWSMVLGGGGIRGGQAVGDTDKDGIDITDKPVAPMDVIATMTKAMGLDLGTQWTTPRGRPIKLVDAGTPIKELI